MNTLCNTFLKYALIAFIYILLLRLVKHVYQSMPSTGAQVLFYIAPPTLLKAHLANIRSTSGLPKLDPFSLYVGVIGKRRGK